MTQAYHHQKKLVLRPAPARIDAVCEKVVRQLALHVLLNKSRMSWCARADEVEIAIARLVRLGLVSVLNVQVDYNTVEYYFLKRNADLVAAAFNRYASAVEEYREAVKTRGREAIEVMEHNPVNVPEVASDLAYVALGEYLKKG